VNHDHPRCGVTAQTYGLETWFRPWAFNGRVVYWGDPCETRAKAQADAVELFLNCHDPT